ncbi:MAG: ABC transporter permease [Solirubrobacteraceae bacterium]|jgi:simple sugar transport system permease protein
MSTATESVAKQPGGGPPERSASRFAGAFPIRLAKRGLIAREGSIVLVTVVLIVYFAFKYAPFLTYGNWTTAIPYFAPYGIIAIGEVFLMINAEIDLSVGGTFLLSEFVYYYCCQGGMPDWLGVIIALAACAAAGLVNGIFTAFIGINSFITTLGMLFALNGIVLVVSNDQQLTLQHSQGGSFASVFGAGTYSELIWLVVLGIILQLVLTRTRWGLHTIAVGSNRIGAAEAGVRVRAILIRNFIVCATLAGLTGLLEGFRDSGSITPDPSSSQTFLLQAIAAAVIGGTLLAGGEGTVIGAMIGALFLGVITDGLTIGGVSDNYLYLWTGVAILLAMVINTYVGRVRRRSGVG